MRQASMKKLLLYGIMAILISGVLIIGLRVLQKGQGHPSLQVSSPTTQVKKYHCPMHPTYVSDKPGDCPICGMRLVPIEEEVAPPSELKERVPIKINPEKQQLIGVKKEKVVIRPLKKTIRAVGIIGYNERNLFNFNTKFAGWIEKADSRAFAGKFIKKGTPLFSIYSPELVYAQQEYLVALEAKKKAEETKSADAIAGAEKLVTATRQKLLFLDITEEQINELAKKGEPSKTMWISAPASGFIVDDELTNGKYVVAGETVFKIVDLSKVWVNAEIYEYEIPYLKVDDKVDVADVELSYYPGEIFNGKITYIYPYLNPTARTVKVRVELPNLDYKLKIDMYAKVNFKIDFGTKLALPVEAVLDSGKRQIVFVDKGDGLFEPREVKLGVRVENFYEVLSGVSEGEEVVVSGNFLIDSESRLKAALRQMEEPHKH